MSVAATHPIDKLLTLLASSRHGAIAVALYERPAEAEEVLTTLRERLPARVITIRLNETERNPIDRLRANGVRPGDVVCLFDLRRASPDAFGYLDLQREVLAEMEILLVCWVTPGEHRDLATKAPNFHRYRTTLVDFTTTARRQDGPDTVPVVFISSTVEDLTRYREAARDAAIAADSRLRMMEYFAASGEHPPLAACLKKVSEVDVLVVIVAHRYGWVPPDQPVGGHKSITWLECEAAVADGKEVLAFLVDEKHPWPDDQREEHAIVAAVRAGGATPDLLDAVQRRVAGLKEFKAWLRGRAICATFTTPEDLRGKVSEALHQWRSRNVGVPTPKPRPRPADTTVYLQALRARTGFIDIRGLQVGTGRAFRFPIEELFISLTTTARPHEPEGAPASTPAKSSRSERREAAGIGASAAVPLHAALSHRQLVVMGDPGSGKTTFLRRVAHALAQTLLEEVPNAAEARLGITDRPLPIRVRVADLVEHVDQARGTKQPHPTTVASPAWLPHFLGAASREANWGLDDEYFQGRLEDGSAIVLLDGLDEAPDRLARGSIARLIQNAAAAYAKCRFVVTSRPAAYSDDAVLSGFEHVWIDPLADEAIHTFLTRWCEALYSGSAQDAIAHRDELFEALASRPDMRRLARNPVMLTALAVVHWNERRLPEQRADLYDSIVKWLSRSREQREGRPTAERCVALLQELALAMQNHPDGRQVQVPRRWAAEAIAPELDAEAHVSKHAIERAGRFLDEEEIDSGLVVGRGSELRFWHLTFQEFLTAKAIAARADEAQKKLLMGRPKTLYLPEWREVVLLLAGTLHGQGRQKVDGFISAVLKDLGRSPTLAAKARCAGLLGTILRDLKPLHYEPADARYEKLIDEVEAIFDAKRSASVPIKDRIEAAEALGQAGDTRIDPKHPKYWVPISAGPFRMGSQKEDPSKPNYDDEAYDDELPPHEVHLDAYRIARYPVTVAEYQRFVEHGGYQERRFWAAGGFGEYDEPEEWPDQIAFPNRPVVGVSWFEAAACAAWSGARLPTEAEWERAARGKEGRMFPWGHEPAHPPRLNYDESRIGRPTPVGIYPLGATPDGIHDLAGNVWEWCADWFAEDYYAGRPRPDKNPSGPPTGTGRVVRGGSWGNRSWLARAACRDWSNPEGRLADLGFRLVVSRGAGLGTG
jgi:formylglycine-generating enzyme required for sulfatase activity